ncbi:hypothetical protein [Blastococcus tunisiensis]|uniref:hypothetical protein n=1 Tax=Blastococcus tunisiensis TaxID=1798228 RepID=UPI000B81F36A|nr:hypothetical protein [Blastococcus sp. DSM 46838]
MVDGRPAALPEAATGRRRRLQQVRLGVGQGGHGLSDPLPVDLAVVVQQLDQLDLLPEVGWVVELRGQPLDLGGLHPGDPPHPGGITAAVGGWL